MKKKKKCLVFNKYRKIGFIEFDLYILRTGLNNSYSCFFILSLDPDRPVRGESSSGSQMISEKYNI